jgi:hypothetical protein
VGHVALVGEMKNSYKILVGKSEGKVGIHSEDLGRDGGILLKCILLKLVGGCGLDSSGSSRPRWSSG